VSDWSTWAEDDLIVHRGRVFMRMEDILNTARGKREKIPDVERAEYAKLIKEFDDITDVLEERHNYPKKMDRTWQVANPPGTVPGVSRGRFNGLDGPPAVRSLDALLWATAEEVDAGTISDKGVFARTGTRNACDQVVVRSEALGADLLAPRIDELPADLHRSVRRFQDCVADMVVFGLMVDKHAMSSVHGFEVARSHRLFQDRWHHVLRALDVDTAGEGGNWVPTGIGASMHEKVRAAGKIAPLLVRIDLPTNPWKWPIEGADATAYRVPEPTGDTETKMTASTPGTLGATFDAEILGGRILFSRSVEADSAVAITPFTRMKLVRAFVDAEERAILDGDTDGTHQDADVHALGATDARWSWDGLRKKGLAQTALDGAAAALSASLLRTLRAMMGKWGLNPSDLAIIVGVNSYYDLLGDSELLTLEKLGPQATILTGQIGSLYGAPVIASEHVRENLNASGVYDGITTTRTYALIVNRQEWCLGQRMALDVEVDDSIYRESFQRVIVAFERVDLQHIGDAATNDDTAIVYEVAP
jgi:HK97 family phage major capsid protein